MFNTCGNVVRNCRETGLVSCLRSSTVFVSLFGFFSRADGKLVVIPSNTQKTPRNYTHVKDGFSPLLFIGLSLLSTPPIIMKKRFLKEI